MATPDPAAAEPHTAGLMQSLRGLAATALDVLKTRFELLVNEFEEERVRILELLVWGVAAFVFFVFSLLLFTFALIVLFWDTHRLLVTVLLGVAYLVVAVVLFTVARARAQRPKVFKASLEELAKDRDTLASQ
jgi:uncharacterized membrane protein YqjE